MSVPKNKTSTADFHGHRRIAEEGLHLSTSPVSDLPLSPNKPVQLHSFIGSSNGNGSSYSKTPTQTSPSSRSKSPTGGSRCYNFCTSPKSPGGFSMNPGSPNGNRDDWKGSHPLPLPPGSPSASVSRYLRQKWKKGRLLGKGNFGHVFLGFSRFRNDILIEILLDCLNQFFLPSFSESGQMCAIKEVKVISDDKDSKECLRQLSQVVIIEYYSYFFMKQRK